MGCRQECRFCAGAQWNACWEKKETTTKKQRSFRLSSNCWTIPTQKNLDFWYYATTTIKLPGNVGPKNMPISLLKAINACPFDWNKCWCTARAVSSCWVVHLSKSVPIPEWSTRKGKRVWQIVSERWPENYGRLFRAECVCVCVTNKKKKVRCRTAVQIERQSRSEN